MEAPVLRRPFASLRRRTTLLLLDFLVPAAGLVTLVLLGEALGFWSPATALVVAGSVALAGKAVVSSLRHRVAGMLAVSAGALAAVVGSTQGLGLQVAVAGAVAVLLALFGRYLLVLIEVASGA